MAEYGKKASEKVEQAMHERKAGTLKSGKSGKPVKSRAQAVAIGLSEARREGAKVPSPKKSSSDKKSTASSSRSSASEKKSSSRSSASDKKSSSRSSASEKKSPSKRKSSSERSS